MPCGAIEKAEQGLMVRVGYAKSIFETVEGADAEFHVVVEKEYRMPDWDIAKLMPRAVVFDGWPMFE